MIVCFSGAQCTGKTTVINAVKEDPFFKDYEFVLFGIRKLAKEHNLGINEHANNDTQKAISELQVKNLDDNESKNVILDRGLLDCMAYTKYMLEHNQIDRRLYDEIYCTFMNNICRYNLIFYIPPEFEMVADGVRSTDKAFRDEVVSYYDMFINEIMQCVKVVELRGTVEDRVMIVLKTMKEVEKMDKEEITDDIIVESGDKMELITRMVMPDDKGKNVVSILSGGLDSTIMTYALVHHYGAERVRAISFNYGQRHNAELEKAKTTCQKLGIPMKVIDISFLGDIVKDVCSLAMDTNVELQCWDDVMEEDHPNYVVPYRNMIFASIALSYAESIGASLVFTGLQHEDDAQFWDCREDFINGINRVSMLNDKGAQYVVPYINMTKAEEIQLGEALGVPFEDTWTCYYGDDGSHKACGVCASCIERITQFKKAHVQDRIEYKS